ncbi:hypothetical protein SEA_TINYMAN4_47 [Microbacterium phage Tinyman4]|nr:hypothetical protein SEA_TINYMAN4_47 [Microbacterium phage Tinyman4]
MNDQNPVNTSALSEIDRLGQKVLDAIWAEEALYNGNRDAVVQLLQVDPSADPDGSLEQMGVLLGTGDASATIRRSIEIWQKGSEREQAVREYLMARRLLASVL